MLKFAFNLLLVIFLGCSSKITKLENQDISYFSDATDCMRSSERKQYVKVPTAGTMATVEVPLGIDAQSFSTCMKYAGHSVVEASPEDYLTVSRNCMQTARDSSNPDEEFAQCVRHGTLTVEPIDK